jgi:predicted enzyme related to lactoylglutathione lyase
MSDEPVLGLVLDCQDPAALAAFWGPALGYVSVGAAGNYTLLLPDGQPGPKLLLQRVPEEKGVKNRMHLDIETADIEGAAARLERLGASRVSKATEAEHSSNWIVMADPEGNEFCVCDGGVNA